MNAQRREITKVFSTVDLLVTPTMMRTAESFAESRNFDPLGTRNTSPFDAFGLPTITVPCGFSAAGLPIGLQITGAPFAESTVLALAHAYERVGPAVASVIALGKDGAPRGQGSGVVFAPDGYLLTNSHVAGGAKDFVITLPDGSSNAIMAVGGFVDAGTGTPVATEVYLA